MIEDKVNQLIKGHLGSLEPECRWCFAVDMERVPGRIVAQYNFPDSTLLHLSCPRCGGEFTLYIEAWDEPYLKNIINRLHPEFEDRINDELFNAINDRVWPEYVLGH